MRQKLFFLMLTLFMLSAASVQAQVTIGADAPPHSSAVLDLQSDNLGFKLPVIELGDVSIFQLSGTADDADGIMIYNSSEETIGGSGKGIYVWEGKWVYAGKSAPVAIPVTKINITSAGYATELDASGAGSTLQLTATVEPEDASNKTLVWTQNYSSATTAGKITVDENGLVTGVKAGSVTVSATATDGSGVYRNLALTVRPTSLVTGITITPINGTSSIEVGKSLQLEATVEPNTAYPLVTWSTSDGAIATVTTGGRVDTSQEGSVTITAKATDGTDYSQSYDIVATPSTVPPLATTSVVIAGTTYQTWNFNGTVWTVDNMRHGTAYAEMYDGDPSKPNFYYTRLQAPGICTDGFSLPTIQQLIDLHGYLLTQVASDSERQAWYGAGKLPGFANTETGQWADWGTSTRYMMNTLSGATFNQSTVAGVGGTDYRAYVIRCVQD